MVITLWESIAPQDVMLLLVALKFICALSVKDRHSSRMRMHGCRY